MAVAVAALLMACPVRGGIPDGNGKPDNPWSNNAMQPGLRGNAGAATNASGGIVGYWGFDESRWDGSVDARTLDDSVYANEGMPKGGANTAADGVVGRCGSFDGVNGRVEIPSADYLKYTGGNMSIALQVKIDPGETDGGMLLSKMWNWNGQYNWWIYLGANHSLSLHLGGHTDAWDSPSTPPLSTGVWHLAVITLDSNRNVNIYADGSSIPSVSATHSITNWLPDSIWPSPLAVGSLLPTDPPPGGANERYFKGCLDEIILWNRCLPAAEVAPPCDVSLIGIAGGRRGRLEFVRGETVTVRMKTTSAGVTGLKLELLQGSSVLASQTNTPLGQVAEFTLDTSPYAYGAYQLKATALQGSTEMANTTATIGVRYVRPESFIYGIWVGPGDDAVFDDIQDTGMEPMLSPDYASYTAINEINAAIRHNMGFTARISADLWRGATWDYQNPAGRDHFRIKPDGSLAEWAWTPGYALRLSHPDVRANAFLSMSNQVAALAGIPAFRPYVVCNDDFAGGMYGWDYSDDIKADFYNRTGQFPPTSMPTPQNFGPISDADPALIWRTWFDYCQSRINAGFNLVERQAVTSVRPDIRIGPIPTPSQLPLNVICQEGLNDGPRLYPTYDFGDNGFNLVSCYCYEDFWIPNIAYTFWMETGHMGNRQMPEFVMPDCVDLGNALPHPGRETAGYVRNTLYHMLAGGVKGINYFIYAQRSSWAWAELKHQGSVIRRIGPVQQALTPAKRDIALLDPFTSYCYTANWDVGPRFYAFANLQQAHFSVDVVAESEILQPGFLTDRAGVLLCRVKYLPQSVYNALASYISGGGLVVMDQSVPFTIPGATRVNVDVAEGLVRTAYGGWTTSPWLDTYGLTGRVQCVKTNLQPYFPLQYDTTDIKVAGTQFKIGTTPYTWFVNTHDQSEYAYNRPFYLAGYPTDGSGGGPMENLVAWETNRMASPYTATVTMDASWPASLVPYDMVAGQRLTYTNRQLSLSMERFGGALVAWLPEAIGSITLSAPGFARLGTSYAATVTVYGATTHLPLAGMVPVEITLIDPAGQTSVVSQVVGASNGVAVLTWTPGINDPQGAWTLSAKEWGSGQTSQPVSILVHAAFHTLTVVSARAGPWPGTLTTNWGMDLSEYVTNSPVSGGVGTQYVCAAGTVTGNAFTPVNPTNVTLTLTNDATLTWDWQTQYWLTVTNSGPGWVEAANRWLPGGFLTNVVTHPSNYYHFAIWTGTVNSAGNPLPLTMDQAHFLVAVFAENLATNGTPHWWLAQFGWTNDFSTAETNDADHDGLLNWQEWIAGTDPTNRLSVLTVTNLFPSASGFVLHWPSVSNRIYGVDRAANPIPPGFEVIATNLPATPPVNVYTDQAPEIDKAFYRIKVEKP